jgi:hypothetical protein
MKDMKRLTFIIETDHRLPFDTILAARPLLTRMQLDNRPGLAPFVILVKRYAVRCD